MPDSPRSSDLAQIEEILERWFEHQHAGETPVLAELCRDEPHLLPRVQEMLDRQHAMLGTPQAAAATEPASVPLLVDRLGDFELKSRIGSGGMGDVYLARQISLDRMVAVKVLRREFADDPLRRLRFKREAQLTAALDHPNIVPVYGTGEEQGHVFLVMKLLDGATLDRAEVDWTPRRAATVGAQVARALHAAHDVGIVHRDIKPGNILVDGERTYVLDFGLARGRVDMTLTTEGQAPGTLAYMPPEQLRGEATAIDPRGDIYSLGVTIYQCLTGHPPFADDSPQVLVRRALIHDPEPLRLGVGDRDLETIVLRAMAKDPQRRFQTALDFAEDLDRYLAGQPIRSRPPSAITRAVKLARRHRVKVAVGGTALAVALVLGTLLWQSAAEREADLNRQFDLVDTELDSNQPTMALARMQGLRGNPTAVQEARFKDLDWRTRSTLFRNQLLDRIQLDSVYRHSVLDEELQVEFARAHPVVRDQPLTHVAHAFLAFHAGDSSAMRQRLRALADAPEYRRFHATLAALLDHGDPAATLAQPNAPLAGSVEDQVFTASLLLSSDQPRRAAIAEIDAAIERWPNHPRAQLMHGVRYLEHRDHDRATDLLTMLWREGEPRPELHCTLARLAILDGDLTRAERHLSRAELDLGVTGRAPMLRLAANHIALASARAQFDRAADLLEAARRNYGESEWLDMHQVRLHLQRDEPEAARQVLVHVMATARAPWNLRAAASTLLHLDVEAFLSSTWNANETPRRAAALIGRADAVAESAARTSDKISGASAGMRRYQVQARLAQFAQARGDNEMRTQSQIAAWRSLREVLKFDDLDVDATAHLAKQVVNLVLKPSTSRADDHRIGDLAYQARRRALEITRRAYDDDEPFALQLEIAVFAAFLSNAVGDEPGALQSGAIANRLLEDASPDRRSALAPVLGLLDRVRLDLGLEIWPDPAR